MGALLRISLYKGGGFRLSLRPAPQGVAKVQFKQQKKVILGE